MELSFTVNGEKQMVEVERHSEEVFEGNKSIRTVFANGNKCEVVYDENRKVVSRHFYNSDATTKVVIRHEYDENGFVGKISEENDNGLREIFYERNEKGAVLRVKEEITSKNGNTTGIVHKPEKEQVISCECNLKGKPVYQKFEDGTEHFLKYNKSGEKIETRIEKNGSVTCLNKSFWSDDKKFKVVKMENYAENKLVWIIHEFVYDEKGKIKKDVRYYGEHEIV